MFTIILKGIVIYFVVLVVIRFMGKREIGQLSVFDFAVVLIMADLLVTGLQDNTEPLSYYIFTIVALSIIQKLLAFLMLKFVGLRLVIDGKPSVIINDGKLNIKEMKKQGYNVDDLLMQLRLKKIRSISEVKYLILETNGEISVFKKSDFQNLNKTNYENKDNNQKPDIYPLPLIVSGQIRLDSLKLLSLSQGWLEKEVEKQGKTIKEIMFANYEDNKLFIAQTKDI